MHPKAGKKDVFKKKPLQPIAAEIDIFLNHISNVYKHWEWKFLQI